MLKIWKITVVFPFYTRLHSRVNYQISFNRYGSGLVAIFNNVSISRVKLVGPDRACAEWLMRNGAFIKWLGESTYLASYDELPLDPANKRSYFLKEVNATGASISHHGFPHFYGCKHVDKILLVKCRYINNEALGKLSYLKNSLQDLEISECKKVTDKGLKLLNILGQMKLCPGEKVIDRLDFVEDTKGNGGDKGRLIVTNLRIIWHSLTVSRISLSIGLNCILSTTTKVVNSKLRGTTEALHILTKSNNARYEFIFTNLVVGNTRHFTSVMGVHKAYLSSRVYRELKLRSAVVRGRQLKILPREQIYTTIDGVWNLSSDQGNLGSFIISNIRVVWFADMNENFNISLPYIQIVSVKIRESRFGPALVVESSPGSGGYVLGFRIDPIQKLQSVAKELSSLHHIHTQRPEFGVDYSLNPQTPLSEEAPIIAEEVQEFDEGPNEMSSALASYYADGHQGEDLPPVYCPQLGIAIETLKDGYTLSSLWEVIPSSSNNNNNSTNISSATTV